MPWCYQHQGECNRQWFANNYLPFIAIAVVFGGGKFLTVELPGIVRVIKDILSINTEHQKNKAELAGIKLDNLTRALELQQKLEQNGVTLETLESNIELLIDCKESMQITPIESIPTPSIDVAADEATDTETIEE